MQNPTRNSGHHLPSRLDVLEPSSSEFEPDDSKIIQTDDEELLSDSQQAQALSPNATIDESMILSDEEEDPERVYDDDVGEQRNTFVSDDDEEDIDRDASRPAPKKIWTGSTKKNYANPVNAATTALMVEDKPWRKSGSSQIYKPRQTGADGVPSIPKSPDGYKTVANVTDAVVPPLCSTSSPTEIKRPLMKYIRGLAQPSPKSRGPRGGEGACADWSDNDDENSSIGSEMISYSSIDSMDESDDELSSPFEDYIHHPEAEPGFWNQLPYVPNHFVHTGRNTEGSEIPALTDKQTVYTQGSLPYLDPQLRDIAVGQSSAADEFHFVLDHRFFLRGLFQLLAERDEVGVEASIHDDSNIIKKGPLKKKYLGMVKVKYVELRRGNLVYYGDGDGEGRKTVHLRSATASCTAIDSAPENEGTSKSGSSPSHSKGTVGTSHDKNQSHGGGSGHATSSLSAGFTNALNAATIAASNTAVGSGYHPGYEFHLWVEGKRYSWLASSKNEQQSWVKAIRGAMIGETVDDDDWGMTFDNPDETWGPHEYALETFKKLQGQLNDASTSRAYLDYILPLLQLPAIAPSESPPLQVPLKWVKEQYGKSKSVKKDVWSPQKRLKTSIAEFWNNMERFDFAINGYVINRESPFAAERIIGSLARCILDFDRRSAENTGSIGLSMPPLKETPGLSEGEKERDRPCNTRSDADRISELNAVSFARNILIMVLKSKTSDDVGSAVECLCQNQGLVRIDPVTPSTVPALSPSPDTLHIDVSFAGDDVIDHYDDAVETNEVSGWIKVRRSKYNSWKKRFCVFSEGVFSYYENAKPRPHGLRGQLLLAGASLSVLKDEKEKLREDLHLHILRLSTKEGERERQFGFETKDEFLFWKESIESVIECSLSSRSIHSRSNSITDEATEIVESNGVRRGSNSKKSIGIIEGGTKLISYATDGGIKVVRGAAGGGIKVVKGAAGGGMKVVKGTAVGGMKVVKGGTKVIKGATGGGMKAIKGATDMMVRSILNKPKRERNLRKSPSLQVLMESTRSEKTGKIEPTVQCVIQTTTDFRLRPAEAADDDLEDTWL